MIGQTLGHYRIESKLGEGGMGVVYRARDTHLDRAVAIKVLPAEAVADPERKRRFVQEAKAASALNHPNIIHIYDVDSAGGVDYIAMEFVDGKTLDRLIGGRGLGLRDTLRYAIQIADALAKAHAAEIVHRDLKPANVMVTEDGLVKVLDFGLARLGAGGAGTAEGDTTLAQTRTEEGVILGTAAYMSPEQAEGKRVDARSDIFSFGSLLYEMVTGKRAFQAATKVSILASILHHEPPPVSETVPGAPAELEKIIARCLRKEPGRRLQHMDDVKNLLEELKEESESGTVVGAPAVTGRRGRRWWGWALAGLALAGWWGWARGRREAAGPPPRVVPFTTYAGMEMDPVFSPEGNQVAFAWMGEKQDNVDIYVKLVGPGTPLRLTTDPGEDRYPRWSPDGRHIAFVRASGGDSGVWMIPALGGSERRLASAQLRGLSWSADGKSLAVVDQGSPQEDTRIFMLSVETGEKRPLTSPPAGYADRFPAFSPDGESLGFLRGRTFSGVGDLYVMRIAAGGEPRRLASSEGTQRSWQLGGIDWTPDSQSIVFSSNRGGNYSLWRILVTGAGAPEPLALGGGNAHSPAVARRGGRLVYTQETLDTNIWRFGSDSPPAKLLASTRLDSAPQYSPDGKRIGFQSDRSGSEEVWVADSEGRNAVQLTSFGGPPTGSPRWSPDGRRLAFDSMKEGHRDIYLISAEGGSARRLTTEPSDDVRPSWSGDGKWIYFGSNRSGGWQVWRAPAEGGAAAQVTRNGGREAFESPDRKSLYYTRFGEPGVWRMAVSGGEETRVLDRGWQGLWALAGQGIYFADTPALLAPAPAIELFRFATGQSASVPGSPKGLRLFTVGSALAVSPDGRWILYAQVDSVDSDILLVENFR